jgi:hypothetical protein
MLSGVPAHVDGRMIASVRLPAHASSTGPHVALHRGHRELEPHLAAARHPHPARPVVLWLDARRPAPARSRCSPASTRSARSQHITAHGHPYTWFLLNRVIIKREFALSGSEQNPDLTGRNIRLTLKRIGRAVQAPVQAFMDRGADFVVRTTLRELVDGMNALTGDAAARLRRRAVAGAGPRRAGRATSRARIRSSPSSAMRAHPQRACHARRDARADPRPGGRPAHRRAAEHPDAQVARRARDGPRRAGAARRRRTAARAVRPARSRASAAAACTATGRWRARSSAAASSVAAPPAVAA